MCATRILLAILALLAAAPLHAQPNEAARADSVLAAACPGARIRLYLAGDSLEGVCGPVLDGRLVVGYAGGERTVPLAGVREIWVQERQTRRGALIGAGAGAALLSLFGVGVVSAFCENTDCGEDYAIVIALGTVVGGATGGLIGAGIGYLTTGWEQRFP